MDSRSDSSSGNEIDSSDRSRSQGSRSPSNRSTRDDSLKASDSSGSESDLRPTFVRDSGPPPEMQMPGKTNQRSSRKPTASFLNSRALSTCPLRPNSAVSSTKEASLNVSQRTDTLSTQAAQETDLPDVSQLGFQSTATTMKRKQSDGGGSESGIDEASRAARGASQNPPGWPQKKVKRG